MPGFFRSPLAVLPLLAAGAVLALAGCADSTRTTSCPGAAILADASVRPVLKPGVTAATDPSAVLYTVRAMDIDTGCNLNRRLGEAVSVVHLTFRATRTPSGQAARYVVPYFLAINQGARIVNKRMFDIVVDFAPGVSAVTVNTSVRNTALLLENGRLPTDYQYLAGFQLSEAEQDYLKTAGSYAP